MCSGGGSPPPVTPAPAPAPAEPPPEDTEIGNARKAQAQDAFPGKKPGEYTRVDRSIAGGTRGGSGNRNPRGSGITM